MMKRFLLTLLAAAALGGCATQPRDEPLSMANDWRTGTDQTPYRSLEPVLVCDGCRLDPRTGERS